METRRVEVTAGRKSLAEGHIPGRCTITICNSDDSTKSHTQEMHSRLQTQ